MPTINDLRQQAATIKNATQVGENTATRVGTTFETIADLLEGASVGQGVPSVDLSQLNALRTPADQTTTNPTIYNVTTLHNLSSTTIKVGTLFIFSDGGRAVVTQILLSNYQVDGGGNISSPNTSQITMYYRMFNIVQETWSAWTLYAGEGGGGTIDPYPVSGSDNAVASNGVFEGLQKAAPEVNINDIDDLDDYINMQTGEASVYTIKAYHNLSSTWLRVGVLMVFANQAQNTLTQICISNCMVDGGGNLIPNYATNVMNVFYRFKQFSGNPPEGMTIGVWTTWAKFGDSGYQPDNEDIDLNASDQLQFANKLYDASSFSGLGRIYLRKNIVTSGGVEKNVLTQAMVNTANTIYHIQYDFDLNGQTITLPAGCVLEFDGGSLANGVLSSHTDGNRMECLARKEIFKDVYLNGKFFGVGYDWMTSATNYEDYLKFSNLCHFEKGIIEESAELNINWWVNPFKQTWNSLPNNISVNSLDIDGRGCRINMLANDESTQKPFNPNQTIYTWGIELLCPFIVVNTDATSKGLSLRNINFIDDKAINGAGSDLTVAEFTYNGHTAINRSAIIHYRTDDPSVSGIPVVCENVFSRSRYGLLYGAGGGETGTSQDTITFNNCDIYSFTNFVVEMWADTNTMEAPHFKEARFNNCIFECGKYALCVLSNQNVKEEYYNGCIFKSTAQAVFSENYADLSYQCNGCEFINVSVGNSPSQTNANTTRVFENCYFHESDSPDKNTTQNFWQIGGKGKLRFYNCSMEHAFYMPLVYTNAELSIEVDSSEFFFVVDDVNSSTPLESMKVKNSKFSKKYRTIATAGNLIEVPIVPYSKNRLIDIRDIDNWSQYAPCPEYRQLSESNALAGYAKDSKVWIPAKDTSLPSGSVDSDGYLSVLSANYTATPTGRSTYTFGKYLMLGLNMDVVLIPNSYGTSINNRLEYTATIGNYSFKFAVAYNGTYKNVVMVTITNVNNNTEYFVFYYPIEEGYHRYSLMMSERITASGNEPIATFFCDAKPVLPVYRGNSGKVVLFAGCGDNSITSVVIKSKTENGVRLKELNFRNFALFVTPKVP